MSLKIDKVQLEIIMKADSARSEMLKLDGDAKSIEKSMKGFEYDEITYYNVECDQHQKLAIEAAKESIVLLKNNGILY